MRPTLAYMPALRYAPAYRPSGAVQTTDQVRVYQVLLGNLRFGPRELSAMDGIPGPNTQAAVRRFQASVNLPQSGQFDPATIAALDRAIATQEASGANIRGVAAQLASGVRPGVAAVAQAGGKMGVNPAVGSIVTKDAAGNATGVVTVPEKVAGTISPAVADQLSKMPPAAAQSFVNDLSNKASQAAATGQTVQNATPVVQPNGTVTAAVVTAPAGWWASQSDNAKAGWIAGGALGAVAVVGLIVYATSGK